MAGGEENADNLDRDCLAVHDHHAADVREPVPRAGREADTLERRRHARTLLGVAAGARANAV